MALDREVMEKFTKIDSPLSLLLIIAVSVFVAEGFVMLMLGHVPKLTGVSQAWVDATSLILMVSPALYAFIFRPMAKYIRQSEHAREAIYDNKNAQLEAIIRCSLDSYLVIDVAGRFLDVSDAYCGLIGYSREQLLGMRISDVEAVEARSNEAGDVSKTNNRDSGRFETQHRRRDGGLVDIEVNANVIGPFRNRIHWFVRDVSARKATESQVRALLGEQQAMRKTELVGFVKIKLSSIEWASPTFEKMMGYDDVKLNGKSIRILFADDDACEAFSNVALSSLSHRNPYRTRLSLVRKDKQPVSMDIDGIRLGNAADESIWTAFDITDRNDSDDELRIAAAAFESREGIMITDANKRILRVNSTFSQITGYESAEVISKDPRALYSDRHDSSFFEEVQKTLDSEGVWRGEVWKERKSGETYPEHLTITEVRNPNGTVSYYVHSFSDSTSAKAAESVVQQLAFCDSLTRLPNRRLLLDRLGLALTNSSRRSRRGALLFIDLDNFKLLNDTFGHDVGDMLLQQVAERLARTVREGDTVARIGGDEFVVMLENLDADAADAAVQAKTIANKILCALNQDYELPARLCRNSASIGITMFYSRHQSATDLIKQADVAMYQAKKAGRNTIRMFDQFMQANINELAALTDELNRALDADQFKLYYQPQVDRSGQVLGAELLIRWYHPQRGLVAPSQFIPLAEESGMIIPISRWVLESACLQLVAWQQHAYSKEISLAVNVSSKQFHQPEFAELVRNVVDRHPFDRRLLRFELTESTLVDNIEEAIATMRLLKETGIQFSLDDFGTGFSSLQYLKNLPLDQLKIDRTFVQDIAVNSGDKAIVRTIIAMSNSLNLSVIAEGVETEEQRQILLDKGCDQYQGYLFGKPMPIQDINAMLESRG